MRIKLLLAAALGLGLLALTSAVVLSWSDVDSTSGFGPDFMVSLPLDDQSAPAVTYNSTDQQFLVVWQDGRQNEWDIYAQIVLTTGVPITNNIVVRDEANKLMDPAVAHSTISDTYLVVWNDQSTGDIEARVVNADDGSLGALFDVEVLTSTHPAITYNPSAANEYLVVYAREIGTSNRDIYGRLVRPDGTFGGPAFVICDDANDQDKPDVVYNATANEYLVVWHDGRGTGWDIYGRRVTAAGVATGTEIPISTVANDQTDPAVAWNGAAGYLVVWQDSRNSTTDTDIYARRIDQGGTPQPNEIRLSSAGAQRAPDVVYNFGANPWLVVWEDCCNQASSGIDIYGQRVPLTGAPAGQGNFVIYDGPNDQKHAALAATGAGPEYLVVWEGHRSGDGLEVVGQGVRMAPGGLNRYNLNVSAPLRSQEDPYVVYNPNAQQFFVVWQDGRERQNEWDIYGQIVLTSGIPITDNIVVQDEEHALVEPVAAYSTINNTYLVVWDDRYGGDVESRVVNADGTLGTAQDVFGGAITVTQPAIAYNSAANEYLVVFVYRAAPTNQDIYGQRVLPNGAPSGAAFPICDNADDQSNPDVAYNATDSEYLVVWYDERNGGSKPWDIYGQRVTAGGTVTVTGTEIPVSIATGDQSDPVVTWNDADDEYLVAWRDGRDFDSNGYDIYGRRVLASGALGEEGEIGIVTAAGTQTAPHVNYITTLGRYFVTWADDRNAATTGWDIYGQNVNPNGSLYSGIVPFFVFSGDQQRPDGDFSPEANRGLTVWQDRRNGTTYKIYGRIKEPRFPVYLPLVLRNTQ